MPQPPQLALSVWKSAQRAVAPEPQRVCPPPHVIAHVPAAHVWPAAQVVPHVPQLALSVMKFAQYAVAPAPHCVSPAPHVMVHAPAEHTSPAAQVVPQPPQLALSVWKFAQNASAPDPHCVSPLPQVVAQTPAEQTCPAEHVVPHVPQLALSVWKFAQYAVAPVPHWVSPVPHDVRQLPAEQTVPAAHEAPAAVPVQLPVAPQYAGLVSGSTHDPPQKTRPAGHSHAAEPPLEGGAQSWPPVQMLPALPAPLSPHPALAPQCDRFEFGSMHDPPQSTRPGAHESWHVATAPPPGAEHTVPGPHDEPALPTPPTPHCPVAPQYAGLVFGSTHAPPQSTWLPGH